MNTETNMTRSGIMSSLNENDEVSHVVCVVSRASRLRLQVLSNDFYVFISYNSCVFIGDVLRFAGVILRSFCANFEGRYART